MPGAVTTATAAGVFPWALARAFRRASLWRARVAEYADGRRHVTSLTATPRRAWDLDLDLSPADMAALRAFWVDNRHKAFTFYDVHERAESGLGWAYDLTGAAGGAGKYLVRLEGDELEQTAGLARWATSVRLVEIQ